MYVCGSSMAPIIRRRVVVRGRVQGVAFRAYARSAARKARVTGWVRNLPDGSVESVVEGSPEMVDDMLVWFRKGSPHSVVNDVRTYEEKPSGEFQDFEITFDGWEFWHGR
ncbi:MAG: acylphosphatase [Pseudomonadota bacterium]